MSTPSTPFQTPPSNPPSTPPQSSIPTPPSIPIPSSQVPSTPAVKFESPSVKSEIPSSDSTKSSDSVAPSVSYTFVVPSFAGWFSFDAVHETERRILSEFFDGKTPSRNPRVYRYLRDSIIKRFRENPSKKITFTEARRGIVGDIGSIRRLFDFLETWGLINYTPSGKLLAKEKRDTAENVEKKDIPSKKLCHNCRTACSLVCFATDKSDIILCARCFVRGNYRPGLNSTDFKRVDISEETRADWTDKETLHLLEAVLHYGEDWKKVAEHVGSRTEKDCVARFIKLPFGEQFMGSLENSEDCVHDEKLGFEHKQSSEHRLSKRKRHRPLTDTSNLIMGQVVFLSALAGSEVAGAAAQSAIAALDEEDIPEIGSPSVMEIGAAYNERQGEDGSSANGKTAAKILKDATSEVEFQMEKEQQEVEQSITDIVKVQMKEIQSKIKHFEEVELLMEKEQLQLCYMKDLFFADQLALLQYKARGILPQSGDRKNIKSSQIT